MVMIFLQLPSSKVQNVLLLLTLITSFDAGYLNGMLDCDYQIGRFTLQRSE